MASSFKSPAAPRIIQLSVNEDGTWKVISDLSPADVRDRLGVVLYSIKEYADRVAAGETEPDDEDADAGE